MQKKLIALAVAAAFSAPAFADTTSVYGVIDAGYGQVTNTPTAAGGATGVKTGQSGTTFSQDQTSRVGVKSVEDLGNGMKAVYQLEIGLSSNPQSDAAFGSANIGTASAGFVQNATISPDRVMSAALDFGQGTTAVIGRVSSPLRGIAYGNDAFYGSNFVGNLVTMDADLTTRANAAAVVQAFGPVTATAALLQNTTTKDGVNDVKAGNGYELTATYKQNALSVSGGYRDLNVTANTAAAVLPSAGSVGSAAVSASDSHHKVLIVAANYDFGMAKLYGQYATVDIDQSIAASTATFGKNTYESLGVNVPFTAALAGYVEASFGKTDRVAHNSAADSRNMSAYAVGVQYNFSKTTALYADVGSAKLDNSTLHAGSKVDQIALGILKSF